MKNVGSGKLTGQTILDQKGETVGKVAELIIDSQNGKVVFFLIKYDTTLGLGGEYKVLPWNDLAITPNSYKLQLKTSIDTFKNSPEVDKDKLMGGHPETLGVLYDYFGGPDTWKQESLTEGTANERNRDGMNYHESEGGVNVTDHETGDNRPLHKDDSKKIKPTGKSEILSV